MTRQIFKHMAYQAEAVAAVLDCFKDQPRRSGFRYRLDPGVIKKDDRIKQDYELEAYRNEELALLPAELLMNINEVQKQAMAKNAAVKMESTLRDAYGKDWFDGGKIAPAKVCPYNLDVEMETGTGKTYVYIKTMFELNKQYGWSKFIVMVPSIAIREGVYKTFQDTADHFKGDYNTKANVFIYNSKHLDKLESFSSNAGIEIMIINTQAFNATGKDARRISMELDEFQSRRPIDVIAANRPILILDEPQKMEGKKTLESLTKFNPLFTLRYSATHKTVHNLVHRLDALDAYNNKLVKKIAVRGISVRNLPGTSDYLYAEQIRVSPSKPPQARLGIEHKTASGVIKRKTIWADKGLNLLDASGGVAAYDGYVISEIDANLNEVQFTSKPSIRIGHVHGDVTETTLRRIQIRETIKAHLEKERRLFGQGIKVLSLFFIDTVSKYRLYTDDGPKGGEYADMFEEEYNRAVGELGTLDNAEYLKYLGRDDASKIHQGYFSMDKKGRMKDPKETARGEFAGQANGEDSVDAYDLILKDKGRLLSIEEPVRFIFSHSALREGWDNPNVFQICTLKKSNNDISRRQEVGRGLRICVNANGDRMDDPATVHAINVLTVVASESYEDFVDAFQKETRDSLKARPKKADEAYFTGKIFEIDGADNVLVTEVMAKALYRYLLKNDYTDDSDHITEAYHTAKNDGELASLPEALVPYSDQVFALIDSVLSDGGLPEIDNDLAKLENHLNENNFAKKEFQTLWKSINRKAVYLVDFDTEELIAKCVKAIDKDVRVSPLKYAVKGGEQNEKISADDLQSGDSFGQEVREDQLVFDHGSGGSAIRYDLIGMVAKETDLTRNTVGRILQGINIAVFSTYKTNPEMFISEVSKAITDEKATAVVEHISYNLLDETFGDADIFTKSVSLPDGLKRAREATKHVYDYVVSDSKVEREFSGNLDASSDVIVYAKLPGGFYIPTPVGNYNPDWAIAFEENSVKHIYFVAETKGTMRSMDLRGKEVGKIECARQFFKKMQSPNVKYDVVDSYDSLIDLVS